MSDPAEDDKTEPRHYAALVPQPIDVIEAWGLNFHLGQVLKYISRMGRKPGESDLDDLKKAQWYLAREIQRRQQDG